jgi:hypothetical protein
MKNTNAKRDAVIMIALWRLRFFLTRIVYQPYTINKAEMRMHKVLMVAKINDMVFPPNLLSNFIFYRISKSELRASFGAFLHKSFRD